MVEDVPEGAKVVTKIHKSPQTPRPKKDKQAMGPVSHVPEESATQQTNHGREGESSHNRNE